MTKWGDEEFWCRERRTSYPHATSNWQEADVILSLPLCGMSSACGEAGSWKSWSPGVLRRYRYLHCFRGCKKTTRMGLQSKRNAQTVYLRLQTNPNMNSPCLILRKLSAYMEYEEVRPSVFLHSVQRKTQAFRVLTRLRAFITHTSGVTVMRPRTCTGNLNQTRKPSSGKIIL